MTDADRQLVELITQQVIDLLRKGGSLPASNPASTASSAKSSGPVPHTAPIQPPIGACTGDYSKFPELAGKLYGSASPASLNVAMQAAKAAAQSGNLGGEGDPWPAPIAPSAMAMSSGGGVSASMTPSAPAPAPQPLPLTGIITANQLQEAMDGSRDGIVWLAPDAKLTPLANDMARTKKDRVRRGSPQLAPAAPQPSGATAAAGALPWLWWIEGGCPVVRDVTQSFGLTLRPVAAGPTSSAISQVTREVARAVKAKQVAGGILFVPSAARAACLANRCPSLRAVVGTCGEAVEQGIREIGANVLIIEYPHHGHRSMSALVQRFTQQLPGVPPSVERDLADLQRCS